MSGNLGGRFITLEGTEGAGKSTNLAFMRDYLEAAGITALVTREPGGTAFAEEIRELVLSPRDEAVDALAETLLIFAARAQHLQAVIKPAVAEGRWVLCDRFTDATYAYQGKGRGVPREQIAVLEGLVQNGFKPDLTIYLDLPVEIGLQRIQGRDEPDRFERERHEFFNRVRTGYLEIANTDSARVKVVDASRNLRDVQRDISAQLDACLRSWQT